MNKLLLALMIGAKIPLAFENENEGGWKMDGDKPAFKDGNPVWVRPDGVEQTVQLDTITRLNAEAKGHRTRAEELAANLKTYEGLDAKAAREAIEKMSKIDAKALIDAGEVDKVKAQIKGEYDTQLNEFKGKTETLQSKLNAMITDSAFNGSAFIRNNVAVPVEMFRAHFGKYFKVENEQLQAFDAAGNRLMSKKSIGEYAAFDEAIELLVESYSQKDSILKASDQRGSGSEGQGGQRGAGRIYRLADFEKLPPAKQAEVAGLVREGKAQLVD